MQMIKIINNIYDVVLLISTSSTGMAYERILDSALWYTRVWNILYVACSYLTYVNVKVSGKQLNVDRKGNNAPVVAKSAPIHSS